MFGLSVFLGNELTDDKKHYLKQMKGAGFASVFTSLHIPEEDAGQYMQRLTNLCSLVKELEMELTADISKGALEILGISIHSSNSLKGLKQLGLTGLRVDYGFSNQEIAFMSNSLNIALNASTITARDVEELIYHEANFRQMTAMHNYYPRPETGLAKKVFQEKNKWLNEIGFTVSSFVSGDEELRGPLHQHLPTLEDHRDLHPLAAALESLKECSVDVVYIGDPKISAETLEQFKHYIQADTILLHVESVQRSPYFERILGKHQNRWDPAKDVLRSADARFKKIAEIKPHETSKRFKGAVTLDNNRYQRYMGETQVVVNELPADEKVNVVAQIKKEDLALLDWCLAGSQFELRK